MDENWMKPLIDVWMRELEFRGATDDTVSSWPYTIRRFLRSVGKKETYDRQDVVGYMSELRRRKIAGSTQRQTFRTLKTFYQANGWPWPFRRGESPKTSEPRRPWLKYDEFLRLLEVLKRRPMHHALFRVAGCTGARASELRNMERSDYKAPYLEVTAIKRGRSGPRMLDPETCKVLDVYLATRTDDDLCLWYGRKHGRITVHAMQAMLRTAVKEAGLGLKHMGMHMFRRSFTTWAYKAGAREKEITDVVGWRTPTMVHEYIQLDREEAMKAVKRAHPMFGERQRGEADG